MSIFEKAYKKYGIDAQMDMVVEECAELIKAIQKWRRHVSRVQDISGYELEIIDEAIDVTFMIEQLKFMLPDKKAWEDIYQFKFNRLREKLDGK